MKVIHYYYINREGSGTMAEAAIKHINSRTNETGHQAFCIGPYITKGDKINITEFQFIKSLPVSDVKVFHSWGMTQGKVLNSKYNIYFNHENFGWEYLKFDFKHDPKYFLIEQLGLLEADAILTPSVLDRRRYLEEYKLKKPVHVIPLFIDRDIPASTKKGKQIGYLGRFCKRKGTLETINYFMKNNEKILFAGDIGGVFEAAKKGKQFSGRYAPLVRKFLKMEENGVSNIRLQDHIPNDELKNFFNEIDVLVFPSRYESFGLVLLESFHHNTIPIINSGNREAFEILGEDYPYFFDIDVYSSIQDPLASIRGLTDGEYQGIVDRYKKELASNYNIERYFQSIVNIVDGLEEEHE